MIVMGRVGGRALRDIFLGSTAEQVMRQTQLPVLVVRLPPRAPYGRPALALDLDEAAHAAVAQLLEVIPDPSSRVTVIHAYTAPYHGLVYPSLSGEDKEGYRNVYRREAVEKIGKLLAAALAKVPPTHAPTWKTLVQFGSPRIVITKVVKREETDLLVLGTRGHSGLAYAFLGTVAGDVLRAVSCDVLVVPPASGR
jgi:nucleotide-binding universal stress UspA family protein